MRVTASSLNVRSGPGTNFRSLRTLPQNAEVDVSERHGDWAWVNPFGWVHSAYLTVGTIFPPRGLQAIKALFGEPGNPSASAGVVRFPAPIKVGFMKASTTRAACHVKLEDVFTEVFFEIHARGFWHLLKTYDGIYNKRKKTANSDQWSTHAWGIAVDLNAATNGFGTKGDMPEPIIEIFEKHGFTHLVNDPMHFQYTEGY